MSLLRKLRRLASAKPIAPSREEIDQAIRDGRITPEQLIEAATEAAARQAGKPGEQKELGSGTDRKTAIMVWPAGNAGTFVVQPGTLIDILPKEGLPLPSSYPRRFASSRVRITSGPHAGRVVFARMCDVQAVSAAEG